MRDQEIISIFQKFLSSNTKESLIYQDITKDILKQKIEKVKNWS